MLLLLFDGRCREFCYVLTELCRFVAFSVCRLLCFWIVMQVFVAVMGDNSFWYLVWTGFSVWKFENCFWWFCYCSAILGWFLWFDNRFGGCLLLKWIFGLMVCYSFIVTVWTWIFCSLVLQVFFWNVWQVLKDLSYWVLQVLGFGCLFAQVWSFCLQFGCLWEVCFGLLTGWEFFFGLRYTGLELLWVWQDLWMFCSLVDFLKRVASFFWMFDQLPSFLIAVWWYYILFSFVL